MFCRCSIVLELNLNLLLWLWPRKRRAGLHAVIWPRRGTPSFFSGFTSLLTYLLSAQPRDAMRGDRNHALV